MIKIIFAFLFLLHAIGYVKSHGRLAEPPNRSSIWRDSRFSHLNPPINYDDNQLWCGGIHQSQVVEGNCGVCGDPYSQSNPKDNEINGRYYRGIITGNYVSGQIISVSVQITVSHMGYMEWRLCPGTSETQSCFNQHLLSLGSGGTKLNVNQTGWYHTSLRLPQGVRCSHCVIQWNYRAGNNWGQCSDGSWATGCGPQETFRGCSDIRIN